MQDVLHCAEEELEEGSFEDNGAQLIGAIHFQELPSLIEILAKMIRIVNILSMIMIYEDDEDDDEEKDNDENEDEDEDSREAKHVWGPALPVNFP